MEFFQWSDMSESFSTEKDLHIDSFFFFSPEDIVL